MNLYFQRSNGEYRLIESDITQENAHTAIIEYVKFLNPEYKIYYTRSWEDERGIVYDIGSHTEFFILTDKTL